MKALIGMPALWFPATLARLAMPPAWNRVLANCTFPVKELVVAIWRAERLVLVVRWHRQLGAAARVAAVNAGSTIAHAAISTRALLVRGLQLEPPCPSGADVGPVGCR